MAELLVALGQQVAILGAQPLVLERAADDDQQLVDLERLLEVVEGAELHGLDGALDARVRRHHDDLRAIGVAVGRQAPDQLEAGRARHQVVDDEQIEAAAPEELARLVRAARLGDVVALGAQRAPERLHDLLFVVHEEDGAVWRHGCCPRLVSEEPAPGASHNSTRTSVPDPARLVIRMVPPSPSTMLREIASPRPVPPRLVVK